MKDYPLSAGFGIYTPGTDLTLQPMTVERLRLRLTPPQVSLGESFELDLGQGHLSWNAIFGIAFAVTVSIACWTGAWLLVRQFWN